MLSAGCAIPVAAQSVDPPAGLTGWWTGDLDAADRIGPSNGALMNGTSVVEGRVLHAFRFDGVDDYVSIPHAAFLQAPSITAEAWIKTPGSEDMQLIVDKSHGWVDNTGWALQVMPRGDGRIAWGYGTVSGFPGCFSTARVDDDAWHHVAATSDGSTSRVYIDGQESGMSEFTGKPSGNTRPLHIGASFHGDLEYRAASFIRFFRGLIDEVCIYDRALSAAEIKAVHAAGAAGKCKSCIEGFDGKVLDLERWSISEPLGDSTVHQDDAVKIACNGAGGSFPFTPGLFGPGVGISLQERIAGDFDIQVAFSDFSGAFDPSAYRQAFLNIYQDQSNQLHVKRIAAASLNSVQSVARVGGEHTLQNGGGFAPVTSGIFRITRKGTQISTFFNGALDFQLAAFAEPVVVSLMLTGPRGSSVRFDNFYVRSGTRLALR
jgi:hypothetical protein